MRITLAGRQRNPFSKLLTPLELQQSYGREGGAILVWLTTSHASGSESQTVSVPVSIVPARDAYSGADLKSDQISDRGRECFKILLYAQVLIEAEQMPLRNLSASFWGMN